MLKQLSINTLIFCIIWSQVSLALENKNLYEKVPCDPALRPSSYPYMTGDTLRHFCDHIIDETQYSFDPSGIKEGDTIFVNTDYLRSFFQKVYPKIKNKFFLVSHNGVLSASCKLFEKYLEDEKLIAWFAKNGILEDHPKMIQIPVGIANQYFPHGNITVLNEVRERLDQYEKKHVLCVSFSLKDNFGEREGLFNKFKNVSFAYFPEQKSYKEYLEDLASSKFVLSPPGTGLDCYRTWEAILVGCIPIIKSSPLDSLYANLPVLIVEDWDEITLDLLRWIENSMHYHAFDMEKLFADHWLDLIRRFKKEIRN